MSRWARVLAALGCVLMVAACDTGATASPRPPATPTPYNGPPEFGPTIPVLWQGAPWSFITIAGALVLGVSYEGSARQVHAISATTGAAAWMASLPQTFPVVLGIVPGKRIVIAQVGAVSTSPSHYPFVTENIALDITTGRQLWTTPVPGGYQAPALAIAGNVVATGDSGDTLSARDDIAGTVLWRRPRPSGCEQPAGTHFYPTVGTAADGSLLTASFQCRNGRIVVQRLGVESGLPVWQWTGPYPGSPALLSTVGAVEKGKLILLGGQVAPPSAAQQFVRSLPIPLTWPAGLGPLGSVEMVLAIDADTGQPRWTELGGQVDRFAFAGGSVCEIVRVGFECRDDLTGAPNGPIVLTGLSDGDSPPYIGDGWAGITGSMAAVAVNPASPGHVAVEVIAIRGSAAVAKNEFAISAKDYRGGNDRPFIVAAGQLPDGSTLALLRRVDIAGYPVMSLRLPN